MSTPILYSLRQCPYAIRARLGLYFAQIQVELREVDMKNKPRDMLKISAKGTVPLLVLPNGDYLDESLEIMVWALNQHDPNHLLLEDDPHHFADMLSLIAKFDSKFIPALERYKAAARYHDLDIELRRHQCEILLKDLEQRLCKTPFIMGQHPSLVDYALLPFIRQFSKVERHWYLESPYPLLRQWLTVHFQNPAFSLVMKQYDKWSDSHDFHKTVLCNHSSD
ncbi:glutathione S-transferase [Photobacterium damselae]|uniref:glutathione S-transferase n=1 Tax=Photobacterium damselae TaxID=38293 RepID=UPI002542EB65